MSTCISTPVTPVSQLLYHLYPNTCCTYTSTLVFQYLYESKHLYLCRCDSIYAIDDGDPWQSYRPPAFVQLHMVMTMAVVMMMVMITVTMLLMMMVAMTVVMMVVMLSGRLC